MGATCPGRGPTHTGSNAHGGTARHRLPTKHHVAGLGRELLIAAGLRDPAPVPPSAPLNIRAVRALSNTPARVRVMEPISHRPQQVTYRTSSGARLGLDA